MSNVIQHPSIRRNAEQRLADAEQRKAEQAKRREELEKEGGKAYADLKRWRHYIPIERRIPMAINMENIFLDYDIKVADLDWRKEYVSIENFRLDVHRMRLPATGHDGRRLVANSDRWVGLLNLIYDDVQRKDEGASLYLLADKLLRWTDFHPARRSRPKSEKLFYFLNALAIEIDGRLKLMSTYRNIAAARAEYFRLNLKGMDEIEWWCADKPECLRDRVADDPGLSIQQRAPAFYKPLKDLSAEDWDYLASELPSDYWRAFYRPKKQEIYAWKRHFDEKAALFDEYEQVVLSDSLAFLPHWFVGFHAYDLVDTTENDRWLIERVSNHGTGDPLEYCDKVDWEWLCTYLVLHPNQAMTRLIPYLFDFSEEGTSFFPLNERDLDNESRGENTILFFKPEPKGVHSISRSLSDRIQESLGELPDSWESTAPQLKNHPYLKWKKEREASIDEHIQAMLEKTGKGRKRR